MDGSCKVLVEMSEGEQEALTAETVLIAAGGHPRKIQEPLSDGGCIRNWTQVYDLDELIVVGSSVAGGELAGAYQALGSRVMLVSSCDRVLPAGRPEGA